MSFLKTYQKSVASFVTVCFVTSFFILPPPALAQPTLEQIPLSLVPLGIPPELASIDEVFIPDPKKESGVPLIHIQSVHAHAQTQKKIYALLKLLDEKYGIDALYIEGAGEKLNPDYFRFFDDNKLNVRVAEKLVEKGALTGAELFLIESHKKIPAYGLEDPSLYRENLTSFEKVMTRRDLTGQFTQETHALLDRLETLLLSPPARKLLRASEAFDAGQMELLSYALELERMTKEILELDLRYYENQLDWPQMIRLLRLQELESKLEPENIQSDRQKLIGFLKQIQINPELVKSFESLSFSPFQSGMVYDPGFRKNDLPRYLAERLVEATMERGFSFDQYPYFTRYLEAAILQSELEAERLFGEMEKLFETLVQKVSSREEEWKLVGFVHEERLLERLFDLELTPKDYAKVEESRKADRPLVRFLLGIESLYESTPHPSLSPSRGEGWGEGKKFIPDNIEAIESVYGDALRFYSLAKEREEVMVEKILTTPSPVSSPPPGERIKGEGGLTILITGGFHTDGLSRQFRKKGIPYTIVSPRITEKVSPEVYISNLLGETKTAFDTQYLEVAANSERSDLLLTMFPEGRSVAMEWGRTTKIVPAVIEVGYEERMPLGGFLYQMGDSLFFQDRQLAAKSEAGHVEISSRKNGRSMRFPIGQLVTETDVLLPSIILEKRGKEISGERGGEDVSSVAQKGRQQQLSTRSRRGQVQTGGEETLSSMPGLLSWGERPTIPTQILPRGGKIPQVASVRDKRRRTLWPEMKRIEASRSPSASAPQPAGETVQTWLSVSLSGPNTLSQRFINVNKKLIKDKSHRPAPALSEAERSRPPEAGPPQAERAEVRVISRIVGGVIRFQEGITVKLLKINNPLSKQDWGVDFEVLVPSDQEVWVEEGGKESGWRRVSFESEKIGEGLKVKNIKKGQNVRIGDAFGVGPVDLKASNMVSFYIIALRTEPKPRSEAPPAAKSEVRAAVSQDEKERFSDEEVVQIKKRGELLKEIFPKLSKDSREELLWPDFLLLFMGVKPSYQRFREQNDPELRALAAKVKQIPGFEASLGIRFTPPRYAYDPLLLTQALVENEAFLKEEGLLLNPEHERLMNSIRQALEKKSREEILNPLETLLSALTTEMDQRQYSPENTAFYGVVSGYPKDAIRPLVQELKSVKSDDLHTRVSLTFGKYSGHDIAVLTKQSPSKEILRYHARMDDVLDYAYSLIQDNPDFRTIVKGLREKGVRFPSFSRQMPISPPASIVSRAEVRKVKENAADFVQTSGVGDTASVKSSRLRPNGMVQEVLSSVNRSGGRGSRTQFPNGEPRVSTRTAYRGGSALRSAAHLTQRQGSTINKISQLKIDEYLIKDFRRAEVRALGQKRLDALDNDLRNALGELFSAYQRPLSSDNVQRRVLEIDRTYRGTKMSVLLIDRGDGTTKLLASTSKGSPNLSDIMRMPAIDVERIEIEFDGPGIKSADDHDRLKAFLMDLFVEEGRGDKIHSPLLKKYRYQEYTRSAHAPYHYHFILRRAEVRTSASEPFKPWLVREAPAQVYRDPEGKTLKERMSNDELAAKLNEEIDRHLTAKLGPEVRYGKVVGQTRPFAGPITVTVGKTPSDFYLEVKPKEQFVVSGYDVALYRDRPETVFVSASTLLPQPLFRFALERVRSVHYTPTPTLYYYPSPEGIERARVSLELLINPAYRVYAWVGRWNPAENDYTWSVEETELEKKDWRTYAVFDTARPLPGERPMKVTFVAVSREKSLGKVKSEIPSLQREFEDLQAKETSEEIARERNERFWQEKGYVWRNQPGENLVINVSPSDKEEAREIRTKIANLLDYILTQNSTPAQIRQFSNNFSSQRVIFFQPPSRPDLLVTADTPGYENELRPTEPNPITVYDPALLSRLAGFGEIHKTLRDNADSRPALDAFVKGYRANIPRAEVRGIQKVLLVEDEDRIGKMVKMFLEARGYQVDWVTSGDEGWKKFQESTQPGQQVYDTVITDTDLPGVMNGFDLAKEIKKLSPKPKTYIAMMSGKPRQEHTDLQNSGTISDFLVKPFGLQPFDNMLDRIAQLPRAEVRSESVGDIKTVVQIEQLLDLADVKLLSWKILSSSERGAGTFEHVLKAGEFLYVIKEVVSGVPPNYDYEFSVWKFLHDEKIPTEEEKKEPVHFKVNDQNRKTMESISKKLIRKTGGVPPSRAEARLPDGQVRNLLPGKKLFLKTLKVETRFEGPGTIFESGRIPVPVLSPEGPIAPPVLLGQLPQALEGRSLRSELRVAIDVSSNVLNVKDVYGNRPVAEYLLQLLKSEVAGTIPLTDRIDRALSFAPQTATGALVQKMQKVMQPTGRLHLFEGVPEEREFLATIWPALVTGQVSFEVVLTPGSLADEGKRDKLAQLREKVRRLAPGKVDILTPQTDQELARILGETSQRFARKFSVTDTGSMANLKERIGISVSQSLWEKVGIKGFVEEGIQRFLLVDLDDEAAQGAGSFVITASLLRVYPVHKKEKMKVGRDTYGVKKSHLDDYLASVGNALANLRAELRAISASA